MTNWQKVVCGRRSAERPRNLSALSFSCHFTGEMWEPCPIISLEVKSWIPPRKPWPRCHRNWPWLGGVNLSHEPPKKAVGLWFEDEIHGYDLQSRLFLFWKMLFPFFCVAQHSFQKFVAFGPHHTQLYIQVLLWGAAWPREVAAGVLSSILMRELVELEGAMVSLDKAECI